VKVLGLDKIESFLAESADQSLRELLNAFVYELRHHHWANAEALFNDYPQAELGKLPKARFRLASDTILIEGVIHFDSSVLLITRCCKTSGRQPDSGDHTEWEAA